MAIRTKNQPRSSVSKPPMPAHNGSDFLLRELVSHLRENRTQLREVWARNILDAKLLSAMTKEEIFSEVTSVYDNYVEVLETGSVDALQAYARNLSERIIPRGVETHEVIGIVLLLRDVLARSLFKKYQHDFDLLNRVLDAYEPAANRIANTVAVSFVQERERIIRQQQEAIRELISAFASQGEEKFLQLRYLETLPKMADGRGSTVFMPTQLGQVAGLAALAGEAFRATGVTQQQAGQLAAAQQAAQHPYTGGQPQQPQRRPGEGPTNVRIS